MQIRSSEKWQLIERAFAHAVELPHGKRTQYLEQSCSTDPELRAEVERLLQASDNAGGFLDSLDARRAASLLDNLASETGDRYIGRYRIIRELGKGGMGVVYLAEDPSLKRNVAIKLLPPWMHADQTANRRLLDEARHASALDHPNIATVHEIGETEDGQLFIAMTYYDGETLRSRIEDGPLTADEALHISAQIASGLSAAHRKGIIHRDIKPENVMLTSDGVAKIVDFGVAKAQGQTLTQVGSAVGTVSYMSPEQSFGMSVDHRTDLWSLGVVLHEMLSGARPFQGERQEAILFAIRSDEPRLDPKVTALPPTIKGIIGRCLQKDPENRYQSAEALLADLRMTRSGEPGLTPSFVRRMSRLQRAVAAAAVVVVAGAGIYTAVNAGTANDSAAEQASVAVLPFTNMSSTAGQEYIADGMADELIHALSGVERLRVVSRGSSFQLKGANIDPREVGTRLGVTSVIDGSVRSDGDSLRVTVHLVDARTGNQIWSEAFKRSKKDILDVQEEISRAIVAKLRVTIPGGDTRLSRSTMNSDAYELYLKGRQLWNERRDLPQAVKYLEQAIALDPEFAPAHLALGQVLVILPFYSDHPLEQTHERARASILRSIAIDSTLADGYGALASMAADAWRWKEAEPYFERAIAMRGGEATTRLWYGEMLLKTGRIDDAIREMQVARRLNPLASVVVTNLGWALYSGGRLDEAVGAFKAAENLKPVNGHSFNGLGSTYLMMGRMEDAIAQFNRALELQKGRGTQAYLGRGYALSGRRAEAESILSELEKRAAAGEGSPWAAAHVAVSLGENDKAITWLERSYDLHEFSMAYVKIDPAFRPLHQDPRFRSILQKMGL